MTVQEASKRVPLRLLRFMLRLAQLSKGRYLVYLGIGDDGNIDFSVCKMERVER